MRDLKRQKKNTKPKVFGCPVGRTLNLEHPTCKTCPMDCTGKKGRGVIETTVTRYEGNKLVTTAYLYSPNHWHGRPLHVYLAQKRKWREVLDGTWALWGKQKVLRRQVTVMRQVTAEDDLIMDDDNLRFSLKPLLDNLKYHSIIIDDSREYIEETLITQTLGTQQLVVIKVKDL